MKYRVYRKKTVLLRGDHNVAIGGVTTALLHQSCPVAVHDCQVVVATVGTILNVESSEF